MRTHLYIFAGGGTGGHLYPGLAVAKELAQRDPEGRILFVCSHREIDQQILRDTGYAVATLPVTPFRRSVRGGVSFLVNYLRSRRQSRRMLNNLHPAAVLGLGGFASAPLTLAGAKMGLRTGLLNPDAVPGKANRMLSKHVECIFTQFEMTRDRFRRVDREKVLPVGCPIRSDLPNGDRDEAMRYFDLSPSRRTLLVFGASLGAASINEALDQLQPMLAEHGQGWQVLQITGRGKAGLADSDQPLRTRARDYCDRMDLAYAAADLAICRAGAVTVAELAATGTPAILLPYPYHKDDHQRLNAEALRHAGGAVVCEDHKAPRANAEALMGHLKSILTDEAALAAMASGAASLAGPDAAAQVARWMSP
jgi:UDP-N-acetylglucosamine--N-acetylmuramyl-(pentapeptide) pyrophosphoryl-undecaprenol N-acetylglucosamine transferase